MGIGQGRANDLVQAERLLRLGNHREAHALCIAVLQTPLPAPVHAGAYRILGMVAAAHGNHEKAISVLDRGLALVPDDVASLAEKARSLSSLQRFTESLAVARAALCGPVDDAAILDTLGVVFARAGDHATALSLFERAVARTPDHPDFLYNLGSSLQFFGRFDDAERAYRRLIELRPRDPRAYSSLVALRKQESADLVPQMTCLFEETTDTDLRLDLGHAIAKTLEDLGDPVSALRWLRRAKEAKLRTIAFDERAADALFAAAVKSVEGNRARPLADEPRPIFIFGLPRTGTTLIERILSSHPAVTEGGELADLGVSVRSVIAPGSPVMIDAGILLGSCSADVAEVARRYLESVRRVVGSAACFTDKMPLNFLYAGVIARALPNARMVCVRRGAMDSCLSIYRQIFSAHNVFYNFSLSLEATARYFVRFDTLVRALRERLDDASFMEIRYEDVVTRTDAEVRRLLEFCGLTFDARCLDFHRNATPVATASATQVRSPIYASSIGRWRRLQSELTPVEVVLRASGIALE